MNRTTPDWRAQDWRAFAGETAEALGAVLECDGGCYRLVCPASEPASESEGRTRKYFGGGARRPEAAVAESAPAVVASGASPAELVEAILERLAAGEPINFRPADQPEAVHDLGPGLFAAYQVDGGAMHLAGCQLTDRPLVRVTRVAGGDRVEHAYFLPNGEPLSADGAQSLGLDTLADYGSKPAQHDRVPATTLKRIAAQGSAAVSAIVWARHAQCRLRFEIGDAWLDLPLAGWARTLRPAPIACPVTGRETYHLAALGDGTIVAAEEVGVCQQSGARALVRDMARCAVTGQTVLAELCELCPVSGLPALASEFETCAGCGERVSRAVLAGGECGACRGLRPVATSEEFITELLARYPKLRHWRRWRIAQTGEVAVVEARRLFRRLRLTVGLKDRCVRRAAMRVRWGKPRVFSDAERAELLG